MRLHQVEFEFYVAMLEQGECDFSKEPEDGYGIPELLHSLSGGASPDHCPFGQ